MVPFLDLISFDGSIRVVSDEFSISLLNPDSAIYRYKAKKYKSLVRPTDLIFGSGERYFLLHFQISNVYAKSPLRDAFVQTLVDGFSSGSVRVFFKIVLDKRFLPR